jgi:tetratricopeptide (TPR) repeat protein
MALRYAALALDELGHHQQAIQFLSRARALAEAFDDRYALSVIHEAIAISEFNQGRLRNALDAFEMLLVIYRESGDKIGVSACLNNIANCQYYLGDFDGARAAFLESIAIAREIAKRAGMAYTLRELGGLSCHRGDYATGLAELEQANTVFAEIDDDAGRAWCDLALGREYYLDVGPASQAEALLHSALPVLQANESHEQVAETLLALGRLDLSGGKEDQARANLDQALALCQNHDLYWHLPEATVRLSELALARGDRDSAASFAQRTLDAIAAGGCPDVGAAAHLVLAQLADEPLHHYQMAVNAARQRSRRIDLARTLFQVGDYLRDRAEPALQTQGHDYLQEAQNLMAQMQLTPGDNGS